MMSSVNNGIAAPLRRLSAWAIDIMAGVPAAFLVVFILTFIETFLYHVPLWAQRIIWIALLVAIWAIYAIVWKFALGRAQISGWRLFPIFAPAIGLLAISALWTYGWFAIPPVFSGAPLLSIWIIGTLFLFSSGRTVGKALTGTQVIRQSGEPVGWTLMLVREIIKSLMHLCLIGFIIDAIMLLSDKGQRQSVSDRIAETAVVYAD